MVNVQIVGISGFKLLHFTDFDVFLVIRHGPLWLKAFTCAYMQLKTSMHNCFQLFVLSVTTVQKRKVFADYCELAF